MAFSNRMTLLLNKIERHLGTRPLNLPEHLQKSKWVDVIKEETITTYSRYYPYELKYRIDAKTPIKDGYYLLDEDIFGGIEILGIRDISWEDFAGNSLVGQQNAGYSIYDFLSSQYGMMDIALLQAQADIVSLYNNGIYVDFEPPNRVKLESATGQLGTSLQNFDLRILVKHNEALTTISPTQMETFEALAECDVARFLYEELKLFEGLETVYANIDLKLTDLQDKANRREEVINYIKDSYVSASNKHQPYIIVQ